MRIARFRLLEEVEGPVRIGALLSDGSFLDATSLEPPTETHRLYDVDGRFVGDLRTAVEAAENGRLGLPVRTASTVRVLAPVGRPGKIVCVGLNYEDHALESTMEVPDEPLIFSKFPGTINDPEAVVRIPEGSTQVDFEAELGVVVGRTLRNCTPEEALDGVLGYTCINDVSARDFQFADGQWQRGKSCDGFCPVGPSIVTTDDIPDPQDLDISLTLNDEVMQESHTRDMIFDVRRIIAHVTTFATLEPGDLIATGTPPGCGFALDPPVWLAPGDRMAVRIGGIGELHNTVG